MAEEDAIQQVRGMGRRKHGSGLRESNPHHQLGRLRFYH
jgi:hypothetical protein